VRFGLIEIHHTPASILGPARISATLTSRRGLSPADLRQLARDAEAAADYADSITTQKPQAADGKPEFCSANQLISTLNQLLRLNPWAGEYRVAFFCNDELTPVNPKISRRFEAEPPSKENSPWIFLA
jgi:hypothetical protein